MRALTSSYVRSLLLPRKKESHKGDYGHVLVVAGSAGMMGAAALCVHGALRAGAGLVTLAALENLYTVAAGFIRPEAISLLVPGRNGCMGMEAYKTISEYIEKRRITSVVLGPGLGRRTETARLVKKILMAVDIPVVLDADAISVMCGEVKKGGYTAAVLKQSKADIVITPHPGEFARLLGVKAGDIQIDRKGIAEEFAKQNGVTCVLKGNRTIVTDGDKTFVNPTGNPGMATGGTGDVLSGMIGALIPQVRDKSVLNAGCAGVFLHGLAADIEARERTEVSLLAGDIAEAVPKALKSVKK